MKSIPLTNGFSAIVDDSDFGMVSMHKWHAKVQKRADGSTVVYARRNVRRDGKQHSEYLHRSIIGAQCGVYVDHANGNTLDNTRENIRTCNNTENQRNRVPRSGCRSGYKGVSFYSRDRKWRAFIKFEGKQHCLGYFHSEIEAAKAYDAAAHKHFGQFARPNFQETAQMMREEGD